VVYSVYQTVVRGPPVVRSGFGRKKYLKIVSDTERMKNSPIHVCAKLPLFVNLQQNVGELLLSATSFPSIIILENI
jgi:hypothetical protein